MNAKEKASEMAAKIMKGELMPNGHSLRCRCAPCNIMRMEMNFRSVVSVLKDQERRLRNIEAQLKMTPGQPVDSRLDIVQKPKLSPEQQEGEQQHGEIGEEDGGSGEGAGAADEKPQA